MKSATIYTRVSTTEQATEGVSLDAQTARAAAWIEGNGHQLGGTFTDAGISGKRAANCPALQTALAEVCRTGGVLVVYSLSRLARSTRDAIEIAERLEKSGADLVSLTEKIDTTSAAGRMIFRLFASFAEFERDLISERTKTAMNHKRANGERIGSIPFGYQLAADGVHLAAHDGEQTTLADLRGLRAAGMSWQGIADTLNARGVTTKTGKRWSWQTARKAAA